MKVHDYKKLKWKFFNSCSLYSEYNTLIQGGDGYDTNFRSLGSKYVVHLPCHYKGIFDDGEYGLKHYCGDFVWDGGDEITVFDQLSSGGHPALTQQGVTCCAGIIRQKTFFFHSGHFKPKAINIVPFMFKFIDNSLQYYKQADEQENCVTKLAQEMFIELYYDDEDCQTVETNLVDICNQLSATGKFKKMPQPVAARITDTVKPEVETVARFWQPDKHSNYCRVCQNHIKGNIFSSNKHHCRMCGFIICNRCYVDIKIENPLSGTGSQVKFGSHKTKICKGCIDRVL